MQKYSIWKLITVTCIASSLGIISVTARAMTWDEAQALIRSATLSQDNSAFEQLKLAAKSGDANAQASLGYMYYYGRGVPQDYAQAGIWYRKAAEQGNAGAQSSLGFMYYNGQGVRQDDAQAGSWYLKAADQSYPKAQYNMGVMYLQGQGVPKDYAKAIEWMILAKANGDNSATQGLQTIENVATPQQISEGQALARTWWAEHPLSHK